MSVISLWQAIRLLWLELPRVLWQSPTDPSPIEPIPTAIIAGRRPQLRRRPILRFRVCVFEDERDLSVRVGFYGGTRV